MPLGLASLLAYLCLLSSFLQSITSIEVGDNKCIRTNYVNEQRVRTVFRNVEEHYIGYCLKYGIWSRRCPKTRMVSRPQNEYYIEPVPHQVEECCDGYLPFDDKCLPDCREHDGCANGECVAHETCHCNDGYDLNDSGICEMQCNNCPAGSHCSAPNHCECLDGYYSGEDDSGDHACMPICADGCVHGTCTAPEQCQCHAGYDLDALANGCVPICAGGCHGGHCSAPDQCQCLQHGFALRTLPDNRTQCAPQCTPDCTNADCVAPNECSCRSGYAPDATDPQRSCLPVCAAACDAQHGLCAAPDRCDCRSGYRLASSAANAAHRCEPICTQACAANAECVAPDECGCLDGYRHAAGECVPHCGSDGSCVDGDCVAPDRCECHPGNEPIDHDLLRAHVCVLKCSPGYRAQIGGSVCSPECKHPVCGFGAECVAPERCACLGGYRQVDGVVQNTTNATFVCKPECTNAVGCKNGECHGPEQCTCNRGYALDGVCVPVCVPACGEDDLCVAPDRCDHRSTTMPPPTTTSEMPTTTTSLQTFNEMEASTQQTTETTGAVTDGRSSVETNADHQQASRRMASWPWLTGIAIMLVLVGIVGTLVTWKVYVWKRSDDFYPRGDGIYEADNSTL